MKKEPLHAVPFNTETPIVFVNENFTLGFSCQIDPDGFLIRTKVL
jgi:hypothetical protein